MKWNQRKIMMAAAIPVIATVLPSVTYATCTNGVPDGPPTWVPSAHISRYAKIGWGTDIGPNVTISKYVRIGICGQIGMDGKGGYISSSATLRDNVTMTNYSVIGTKAVVGDNVNIDGTRLASHAKVGAGSSLTKSYLSTGATTGTNATVTGTRLSSYASTGTDVVLTGVLLYYKSHLGDGVIIDAGTRIGRRSVVNSGVHVYDHVYVGSYTHICADVSSGMRISSHTSFGC